MPLSFAGAKRQARKDGLVEFQCNAHIAVVAARSSGIVPDGAGRPLAHGSKNSVSKLARDCSGVSAKSGVAKKRRSPAPVGSVAAAGVSPLSSRTVNSARAFTGSVTALQGRTRPWSSSTSTVR